VFLVLEAHSYLDESGVHQAAQVCVIAGYFGTEREWFKVEKLWRRRLRKFNVPLEEFHTKDLVNRAGFFHGWPPARSVKLQFALAEAVAQYQIYPVAQGILVKDFYNFSLNERRFLTGATLLRDGRLKGTGNPSKPYFAPFQPLVKRVLEYAPATGRAHFYFGLDRPFSEFAGPLYKTLKSNPDHPFRERFGDISFPMAKETPALQAADLLSYLTYSHMLERAKTKAWYANPPEVVRILLSNLRAAGDLCYQDEQNIRDTLGTIPIERRMELLRGDLAS
jgi:hypothetical protein